MCGNRRRCVENVKVEKIYTREFSRVNDLGRMKQIQENVYKHLT